MHEAREEHRVGLGALRAVTELLQRRRAAHPTAGLYEAADLQWWWAQQPRPTDDLPQLFWFDHLGRPEAAVITTDSGDRMQLDPMVMPDAAPDVVAHVVERGLEHAGESGVARVSLEVDIADDALRDLLVGHGFTIEDDGLFWYDPGTATGLVEPMRTEDDHRRRGLARHILTTGIDRLAATGAERIKICYETANPASRDLYLGVGSEPDRETVVFSGPTNRS
jgi:GNAT superfamily N-acetyltransferase